MRCRNGALEREAKDKFETAQFAELLRKRAAAEAQAAEENLPQDPTPME